MFEELSIREMLVKLTAKLIVLLLVVAFGMWVARHLLADWSVATFCSSASDRHDLYFVKDCLKGM